MKRGLLITAIFGASLALPTIAIAQNDKWRQKMDPSKKLGYGATIKVLMTERGAKENLQPLLEEKVREWIKTSWPFAKVAFPGIDVSISAWNQLPDAGR